MERSVLGIKEFLEVCMWVVLISSVLKKNTADEILFLEGHGEGELSQGSDVPQ